MTTPSCSLPGLWTPNSSASLLAGVGRPLPVYDGYDPTRIKGAMFFHDPKRGYVKLTKSVFDRIAAGAVKI